MTSDAAILINRDAEARALSRPDLRAMRADSQEAYGDACAANANAAAHKRYRGEPNAEAEAHAEALWAYYRAICLDYEAARERALVAEGYDPALVGETEDERGIRLARERERLENPPVGWGTRWGHAERRQRWQARPVAERLSDLRPREVAR